MAIYDKPAWQLIYEMVENLGLEEGEILSKSQVMAWFAEHYAEIRRGTISAQLTRLSTNAPSRVHYHAKPGDHDLFFQVDGSHFRLYEPEKDPLPIYEHSQPEVSSSLTDDILRVIQKHERAWQKRLQEHENRVRALEQENERLRTELEKRFSVLDEITDEVLKERLSRLGSARSDTVIREAGVVLEHRLRNVSGVDSTEIGVKLVDVVLAPETGILIFSTHRGEQDGVRMLYRGAMQFIRNASMHKLTEYPENTVRLFIRLIDSLLQLLSELEPRHRGEATVDDIRHMLTRIPVTVGQRALYKALYAAGDQGLSSSSLTAALDRSRAQLAGVLGALGRRVNGTEGLEGKGGTELILEISLLDDGDWRYRMRQVLREALEAEGIV
jgi:hypothetical protein